MGAKHRHSLASLAKRLGPFFVPHARWFAGAFVLMGLCTGLEVALPWILKGIVDGLEAGAPYPILRSLCWWFLAGIGMKAVLEVGQSYGVQVGGQQTMHDLRTHLFGRIQGFPVAVFDSHPTGRLQSRVINDIKALGEVFTAAMSRVALDIFLIVGTIVGMLLMQWQLAVAVLLLMPVVAFSVRFFGRRLAAAYRKSRARLAEVNAFFGENLGALSAIQRLSAEQERFSKCRRIVSRHRGAQWETVHWFAIAMPWINLLGGAAMAVTLVLGGYWVVTDHISMGVVVAFLAYVRNLFHPVEELVQKYNVYLSARVAAERVVEYLGREGEGEGDPEAVPPVSGVRERMGIAFRDVSFAYPSQTSPALRGVSFEIGAGEAVAIVGATGSGKSTLIRLLLRFYEPTEGAIFVGGKPLSRWPRSEIRQAVGVIHQDVFLFEGTLRDNLLLGRFALSDGELVRICQRAELWPYVERRGGLDFGIKEGGANLSLGERQLIAFARVLVMDPPALVLDEATASLDGVLEARLMGAVREALSGRTSVVIAHRLSTIRECDRVVVLERGELREMGTHQELRERNGLFAHFQSLSC